MAAFDHCSSTSRLPMWLVRRSGAFHICDTPFGEEDRMEPSLDGSEHWLVPASAEFGQRSELRDERHKLALPRDIEALIDDPEDGADRPVCKP